MKDVSDFSSSSFSFSVCMGGVKFPHRTRVWCILGKLFEMSWNDVVLNVFKKKKKKSRPETAFLVLEST